MFRVISEAELFSGGVTCCAFHNSFGELATPDYEFGVEGLCDFRDHVDQRRRLSVFVITDRFASHSQVTGKFPLRHSGAPARVPNLSAEFVLPAHTNRWKYGNAVSCCKHVDIEKGWCKYDYQIA